MEKITGHTESYDALQSLHNGQPIILGDDATARVSFFLVCPALHISTDDVLFLIMQGRGVICAAMSEERAHSFNLPKMPQRGISQLELAASVEARHGVTTGISAADRAQTLRVIASTNEPRRDLVMPGHISPALAKKGGVLVRLSPSEAAVDLMRLAGLNEVAALTHCLDQNGELLDEAGAKSLALRFKLPLIFISDVVKHRLAKESIIEELAVANLPMDKVGEFKAVCFRSLVDEAEHLALVKGDITCSKDEPILVRVHAERRLGDLLSVSSDHSHREIQMALDQISQANKGVFIYVRHPRRGLLQDEVRTLAAGESSKGITALRVREYGIGSQILSHLKIKRIKLISNSVWEIPAISAFDLEITQQVPLELGTTCTDMEL